MSHSTADWFAAIEPVANRAFYGLESKTTKQFSKIFSVGSDDEPIASWVEYGGPGNINEKAENAQVQLKEVVEGPIKTKRAATYAGAMVVSYEAAKDVANRYARVVQTARTLGRAVDVTPELLTALMLDRAFDTSFAEIADGLPICSASHTIPGSGTTFSNLLSSAPALDETAMEDAMVQLRSIAGSDGNIEPRMVKGWIVPSALTPIAEKLNTSAKTIGSANNDPSVVNGKQVIPFDYLGSSTRWFAATDLPGDMGLFWDWIEKPTFEADQVILLLQKVFVAFFRARYGCKNPRAILGSNAS